MKNKKLLLLSMGDPAGIGPVILLKAVKRFFSGEPECRLAACAPRGFLESLAETLNLDLSFPMRETDATELESLEENCLGLLDSECCRHEENLPVDPVLVSKDLLELEPKASALAGLAAWRSLACARHLTMKDPGKRALVTSPINKEAMALAGFRWPGHTEYLEAQDPGSRSLMWLHSQELSVGLVSNHHALGRVAAGITPALVEERIRQLCAHLDQAHPGETLKVLALNPHAGDGGLLGREEIDWLRGLLLRLKEDGLNLDGPLPADAALSVGKGRFLAMYHDQGLPVFKLVAGMKGVNVTLGLHHVRTSPDHGTAFDLRDRGLADEGSQLEAMRYALRLLEGAVA